jgi:TolB protein
MDPTWSPNGQEIAFIRWEEPRGVWVRNLEKDHEWRAFDWTEPRWTSWSPQGDEIMFSRVSGGRLEEREFCFWGFCFTLPPNPHWITGIVSTDGSSFYEPTQPHSQVSRAPSWSPDGEKWVFADVQGLRVQTLDGSVSYEITHDAKDTSPTWSPDGDRVALVRRQHDHWEIYVVDADGRNPRRLTDTPQKPNGQVGNSVSPAWSPDGDYIAFLSDRSGKWEIWLMQANGSGQRPMFDTELDGLRLDYAFIGERAISWTE